MLKKLNLFLAIISLTFLIGGSWFALLLWAGQTETATAELSEATISLPVNETAYKITLEETGIYEIGFAELQAAGLGAVDPNTFQLMHHGQSVAYQFIGDTDNTFEAGEKIRFFGWAFDGSRSERQYVQDNIYWLWPNGTPTHVTNGATVAAGTIVTNFQAAVHLEEDHVFDTLGSFNDWDSTGFEPDSAFWQQNYRTGSATAQSVNEITFTLPFPDETAATDAQLTHVVAVRAFFNRDPFDHAISFELNRHLGNVITHSFLSNQGDVFSIVQSVPITHLGTITNTLAMTLARLEFTNTPATILLNYIEAEYPAKLSLYNNQLLFNADNTSTSTFQINRFTQDSDNVFVWDISDPYTPISHTLSLESNDGGYYTHTVNISHTAGDRYIAAETAGVRSVKSISSYTVADIEPVGGSADWVAISHPNFMAATQSLADHRANYSHLSTHVVSLEDVANIHNGGFVSAEAIKAYLQHAYDNWDTPPQFALLVGDGNFDPRGVICSDCPFADSSNFAWDDDQESFMPFNFAYVDRFQGLIPSDYDYALLAGDDLYPDIAVGRFSVETAQQATNVVNKIIQYEENILAMPAWQDNILFVHDQPKGYDFRAEINKTLPYIPDEFNIVITGQTHISDTIAPVEPIRTALQQNVNAGVSLVNWRGHGATGSWGGDKILTTDNVNFFTNLNQPMVIISMDCLDGNFAYPYRNGEKFDGVSETFLRQAAVGTAAHWSSTGLGFPAEHEILAKYFYLAQFNKGLTTIGQAIDYAKTEYLKDGYDESEAYTFLLQGDPAMLLFFPHLDPPTLETDQAKINAGEQGIIEFSWTNQSPYTASNQTTIYYQLPEMVTVVGTSDNISVTTIIDDDGNTILVITFPDGIPGNDTTHFTVTLEATSDKVYLATALEIDYLSYGLSGTVDNSGLDVYLPILVKP